MQLDSARCVPSMLDKRLLAWIVEVNGLPAAERAMQGEVQEEAYGLSLIPCVP